MNATQQMQNVGDELQMRELTQKWFEAWSPKSEPFTGEGLERVFATQPNQILVFDNFEGGVVVLRSLKEYIDTWVPFMQVFSYWEINPEGDIEITVDRDLAVSTFTWVSNGRFKDAKEARIRQHGTHVWRRSDQWRLVHEHLTVGNPTNK